MLFGNIDNLDIDPDNPFGRYKSPDNFLSTVNSGKRYARAYSNMINDPKNEFLVPIIFSSDETKVSNQGKSYSWPIVFTTSILNQEARNKSSAWRLLGFVPDFKLNTSANEEKQFGKHLKSRRLHQALKVILKSFIDFQKEGMRSLFHCHLGNIRRGSNSKQHASLSLGICKEETKWLVQQYAIQTK